MFLARTGGADDTRALAAAMAELVRPGDLLLLVGGLGAGKTTFAQGFAARLGVQGPVTSPTFTLVRQYPCSLGQLLHADLYRLDRLAEVADLALSELLESGVGAAGAEGAVALVEWGDGGAAVLGPDALTVTLARPVDEGDEGDDARTVTVTGGGAAWVDRWASLAAALVPWARTAPRVPTDGAG